MARAASRRPGLAPRYRHAAQREDRRGLLKDVWAARDAYISVILAAGTSGAEAAIDQFFAAQRCAPALA